MAETNTASMPETSAEKQAAPAAPTAPAQPAPEMTNSKEKKPSNVIQGVFGDKRAMATETEKRATEQNKTAQYTTSKKEPNSKPPKDKPQKATEDEKPKKAQRIPRLPKGPKEEKQTGAGGAPGQSARKEEATPIKPEPLPSPRDATRPGETEQIVYIIHAELFPFKNHPFHIRDDDAMKSLVESVKERGVDQPALVRPREGGGYEMIAGHRRRQASELAGYTNIPCVIRNMSDDEAVLAMAESNLNQRAEILPSERAKALKMQLEAIKHQGARNGDVAKGDIGKRSNEIVADRNKMAVKQVQRYIALNNLVPDLMALVDDKKMKFTTAVELSYIKPKNQRYIAVAIDAQQSVPSGVQAQRMRELDQQGVLNGDVIDGIMLEEKKEETRVILNSQELGKYFGPEKSPREMKDQILSLLDEWKNRQPELAKPAPKKVQEK